MARSTHCRFCGKPGDLIKGAHRECKNAETRDRQRVSKNIDPSRYQHIGDRGKCKKCDNPAETLSKLNLCRFHMEENAKEVIRRAKSRNMRKARSEPQHKQPRVYVKPPQSQKLQRVSKVEKRAVEVLQDATPPEVMAELLRKARESRVELPFSRWS